MYSKSTLPVFANVSLLLMLHLIQLVYDENWKALLNLLQTIFREKYKNVMYIRAVLYPPLVKRPRPRKHDKLYLVKSLDGSTDHYKSGVRR